MKSFADPVRRGKRGSRTAPDRDVGDAQGPVDLQQAVGNRALARLLSAPTGARELQRWPWFGGRAPTPTTAPKTYACTVEGLRGVKGKTTFAAQSVQVSQSTRQPGTSGPSERGKIDEIVISKQADDMSDRLFHASVDSTSLKLEVAFGPNGFLRSRDVVVVSVEHRGGADPFDVVRFSGAFEYSTR